MKNFVLKLSMVEQLRSSLAIQERIIDTVILAEDSGLFLPRPVAIKEPSEVIKRTRSKSVASLTIAAFNAIEEGNAMKIGVVATPCQPLALAKIELKPFPEKDSALNKLALTVGLFCGWALSWRKLRDLSQERIDEESITGLDIPLRKYHSMEVHTTNGII